MAVNENTAGQPSDRPVTKLPALSKNSKVHKRPINRGRVINRGGPPLSPKQQIIYVGTKSPFMGIVNKIRHALDHSPASRTAKGLPIAARMAALNTPAPAAQPPAEGDEILVRATGRAMATLLHVAAWFGRQNDCRVSVRTMSLEAVDDVVNDEDGAEEEGGFAAEEGTRVRGFPTIMSHDDYVPIPLDDGPGGYAQDAELKRRKTSRLEAAKRTALLSILTIIVFVLGFTAGNRHGQTGEGATGSSAPVQQEASVTEEGSSDEVLLPAQVFVPEFPTREIQFDFPTKYEDTSIEGDKLWDALMPLGSGFVRVPYPRRFDMPASKTIEDDQEEAEIYSLSALHQLHCLGVIRDVIKRYEKHERSRFAGAGHEYHCIDYIRQSIMCHGDTTLDFAEVQADGVRRGFSGANSTHQCRDWDALTAWAVENRAGDKKGIA
ncbi:hypothetical protein VMCG_06807 [Cytospora schulzeri]|uniref:Uncharacterized protein n=1 Tax=Cytospora schulzeri TaxID=448051 RepID=A0A423W5U3_9PEZI|nr:hypothetical protein VMCG_06807 [Valsa malicola]